MNLNQNTPKPAPKTPLPPISGYVFEPVTRQSISAQGVNLALYSEEELIELRAEIDALLPARRLRDVNVEVELVRQLAHVQKLQKDVLTDDETPANQRAQVAGAVGTVLATLSKLQIEVYTSERLKKIEAVLIECVTGLPMSTQEAFFDAYETKLG